MPDDNNNGNSIKERILERIKKGEVKMRPKFYFLLKTILVIFAIFSLLFLVLFLVSFVCFHLRLIGLWYLPLFHPKFFWFYFKCLPWLLIIFCLVLILLVEILAKRFSFVWRKPIVYSLLVIILFALIGGLLFEKTGLHSHLFFQTREGKMPLMAPIYQQLAKPPFGELNRGIVEEINEGRFKIRTFGNQLLEVYFSENVPFSEIKEGDSVVVIGKREDGVINAFDIKKIDDSLREFEKRMFHGPKRDFMK